MAVFFTVDNLEFAFLSGRVNALQKHLIIDPERETHSSSCGTDCWKWQAKCAHASAQLTMSFSRSKNAWGTIPPISRWSTPRIQGQPRQFWKRLRGILNIHEAIITDLAIPVAANLGPGTVGIVAYAVDEEEK